LEWTKTKSGNFTFDPKNLDFEVICQEVIDNLSLMANTKKINIKFFNTKDKFVLADKHMLTTILRNLISNSIKFTNVGGIINIYLEQSNTFFTVTISDNGIGIAPNRIDTLFEISHMSSTLGTQAEKGNGLGLLLCKELIERHKGKIWAENNPNGGTNFYFTLPFATDHHNPSF
nr:HAMP domain-containing histidine kinase [Leptospiraceae bacterium]